MEDKERVQDDEHGFGIMYDSDTPNSDTHSHEIFLITWDGRVLHNHGFSGITSFDVGHRHGYSGVTAPAPSGVPHTLEYATETTFDDRHTHFMRGRTGPAIPLPGGGHFHFFKGMTTRDGAPGVPPHTHFYSGRTGNAMLV